MHLGATHSQAGEALKRPEGGQEAAAPLPACASGALGSAEKRGLRKGAKSAFKWYSQVFSQLPMSRTDVVGGSVWAYRTLSGGVRPQIAGSYLPPDAPKLAQASKMVVLTHLSDDRS